MGLALTIPGVVDGQDLQGLHPEPDGVTFEVMFDFNDTASRLMMAHQVGERYELVVLTTEYQILALDDVYVVSTAIAGGSSPDFRASLQAAAVRVV